VKRACLYPHQGFGWSFGIGDMDTAIAGLFGKHDGHQLIELAGAETKTGQEEQADE
jgi:hypothetical protein